jgi:sugar lactone lactonase YvrE
MPSEARPAIRRTLGACAAAAFASLALAGGASALDDCTTLPDVKTVYSSADKLESVGVDPKGHVFFTDSDAGELLRLRNDGRPPRVLTTGIDGPGGIVFGHGKKVFVGFGDSLAQGSDGSLNPEAGLYVVNKRTGEKQVYVDGLQMANGVARGRGAIYASTDFGTGIDKIVEGRVQLEWATLDSPNGMISDAAKKTLFANETFTTPTIMRIPFDDPGSLTTYFTSTDPADATAGLDGLTRGDGDTLYAAANLAGEIWRIDGPSSGCVLAHLPPFGPSNVAFGRGNGIPRTTLLVSTFNGELLEIPDAR